MVNNKKMKTYKYLKLIKDIPFNMVYSYFEKEEVKYYTQIEEQVSYKIVKELNKGNNWSNDQYLLMLDICDLYLKKQKIYEEKVGFQYNTTMEKTGISFFSNVLSNLNNKKLYSFFNENEGLFSKILLLIPLPLSKFNLSVHQIKKIIDKVDDSSLEMPFKATEFYFFDYLMNENLKLCLLNKLNIKMLSSAFKHKRDRINVSERILLNVDMRIIKSLLDNPLNIEYKKNVLYVYLLDKNNVKPVDYRVINYIKEKIGIEKICFKVNSHMLIVHKMHKTNFIEEQNKKYIEIIPKDYSSIKKIKLKISMLYNHLSKLKRKKLIKRNVSIDYIKIFEEQKEFDQELYLSISNFIMKNKNYYNQKNKTIKTEGYELLALDIIK